jgi:hypothetical protein
VITLVQSKTDNINPMIAIAEFSFIVCLGNKIALQTLYPSFSINSDMQQTKKFHLITDTLENDQTF